MNTTTLDEEVIEAIRLLKKHNFFVVKTNSIQTLAEPYINLIEPYVEFETRKETRRRLNKAMYDTYGENVRLDISVYNYIIKNIRNRGRVKQTIDYNIALNKLSKKFGKHE